MRVKIKRGYDINLKGKATNNLVKGIKSKEYAFKPTNFQGIDRPKILVQEGEHVKAGTAIFFDKKMEQVKYTAPVSGKVTAVVRGERRKPLFIKIEADETIEYAEFTNYAPNEIKSLTKEQVMAQMTASGVWANIIERPFGLVANPEHRPKAIFISTFDTSPLAPDYDFVFQGQEQFLQAGLDAISKLTEGKVHISLQEGKVGVFKSLKGVEIHEFSGPHPAGNVGTQIHKIDPINKEEFVWTLNPYGLRQIGKLFLEGRYDASKVIAVAGSEVKKSQYYEVITGTNISDILGDNYNSENTRIISGNVLTGEQTDTEDFLGYYDNLITILPEGNDRKFLGWILPGKNKLSFHRAFGLSLLKSKNKEYTLNTNLHGEERAFVQTGSYERVTPIDILPMYLFKAIMARDFEEMEALGIYEVIEEDIALCEFIDVSKTDLQEILREGLDALQEA